MPNKKSRTVELPMHMMRAQFSPNSFDPATRTIKMIWAMGTKGLRSGYDGTYFEELSMDKSAVRLDRLQSGNTPFCDNHGDWSGLNNEDVLGVVITGDVDGVQGECDVRLADPSQISNVDAADTIRKIESGILKNISVGYTVYRYERQPMAEGETIPTYLAVDWEPTEISIVPVGFDPGAAVRSGEQKTKSTPCVFINNEEPEETRSTKETLEMTPEQIAEQERKLKESVEAAKTAAIEETKKAERARASEIRSIGSKMELAPEFVDSMISSEHDVAKVRELAIDKKVEMQKEIRSQASVSGGGTNNAEKRTQGIENALMHRANPATVKLTEDGRNFRGMTLMEMARDGLNAAGIETRGMQKMDLATRAFHTTSDFPNTLANVANKSLRKGYEEAPRTFLDWAKQASLADFKQVSRNMLGEAPTLVKVNEAGEITRGSIGESSEKYQLATYARIIAISRQVLINDDLQAFTDMPAKFGAAAASLESDIVYSVLTANPLMSDGNALFSAPHLNLGTQAALGVSPLGEARKLLRLQQGLSGRTLNLMSKFLLVPAGLETVADQLVSNVIAPALVANAVPSYIRSLTPIVEPRLDAASPTAFYVIGDKNLCDTVEFGYLDGQDGVYSETRQGFDVDGVEIKARLDFAAKALDWRNMVKNLGA